LDFFFFQYDLGKTSSIPYDMINHGFENSEILQSQDSGLTGQNDRLKRCNTTPTQLSRSPESSPARRGSLPVGSLTSIYEHEAESSTNHQPSPQNTRNGSTNVHMTTCTTVDESNRLDKLKEVYIDVEMQRNSLHGAFNAL
jgi:hypothetical protein